LLAVKRKSAGTTFLACSLIYFGGVMLLAGHKYYCPSDNSTTDYPRKYADGYSAQSFQIRILPINRYRVDLCQGTALAGPAKPPVRPGFSPGKTALKG
jgi:hypothetical protein